MCGFEPGHLGDTDEAGQVYLLSDLFPRTVLALGLGLRASLLLSLSGRTLSVLMFCTFLLFSPLPLAAPPISPVLSPNPD